jgi:polyisoprenoid-binding protein YceI
MRKGSSLRLSAGFAALMLGLGPVFPAGAQTRFSSLPNASSVKIEGTSTMHDWEMEGKLIGGYVEFGSGVKLDPSQTAIEGLGDGKVPVKVHALIPVTTIHSKAEHSPDVMDHLMQNALKTDNFPRIEYSLTEMTPKGSHEAGKPFEFDTTGDLTIAGATNKVSFPVTIDASDASKIRVSATVSLKMTAYGVDPPAPNIGLGLMRCGDEINIILDWTLKKRE